MMRGLLSLIAVSMGALAVYGGASARIYDPTANSRVRTYIVSFAEAEVGLNAEGEQIVWEAAAAAALMSSNLIIIKSQHCPGAADGAYCVGRDRANVVVAALTRALGGGSVHLSTHYEERAPTVAILVVGGKGA